MEHTQALPAIPRRSPLPSILLVLLAFLYLFRNVVRASGYIDAGFSDFGNYWQAARALLAGDSPFGIHNFDYPPLLALLMLPLAPLEYLDARVIWFWFGHGCLLVAALLVWRRLGGDRLAAVVVAAVWTLSGTVAENLVLGQLNPLLLLLITLSLVLPPCLGTTVIAGAAALKLWPATLLLADALRKRWRLLMAGAGLAAALVLIPVAGFKLLLPQPHVPQSSGFWAGTPALLSFSFPSTVLRLASFPAGEETLPYSWTHGNNPATLDLPLGHGILSLAVAAITLLAGMWLIWRTNRRHALDRVALLGALVAVTLAAAPICWYHYHLMQFPAIAYLGVGYLRRRQWWRAAALAVLTCGLTWLQVILPEMLGLTSAGAQGFYYVARGLFVPVLSLLLAVMLLRSDPPPENDAPGRRVEFAGETEHY